MLLSSDQLVQQIHDSPTRIVLAASGGGSRAIAYLLEVPGGSRTLLEAVVPYSPAAMAAWLGAARRIMLGGHSPGDGYGGV